MKTFGNILTGIFAVLAIAAFVVFIASWRAGNLDLAAKSFILFCILAPLFVLTRLAVITDFFEDWGNSPFGWF